MFQTSLWFEVYGWCWIILQFKFESSKNVTPPNLQEKCEMYFTLRLVFRVSQACSMLCCSYASYCPMVSDRSPVLFYWALIKAGTHFASCFFQLLAMPPGLPARREWWDAELMPCFLAPYVLQPFFNYKILTNHKQQSAHSCDMHVYIYILYTCVCVCFSFWGVTNFCLACRLCWPVSAVQGEAISWVSKSVIGVCAHIHM